MDGDVGLVSIGDIREAARSVAAVAVRTPVLRAWWAGSGADFWLKPENLQVTGSFKVRGAYNAISRLSEEQRAVGVVTFSSGNHAQGLAYAAREFGVPCTVVMAEDSARVKIEATRALGADVVIVPVAEWVSRAERLVAERGYALIPPFDHADVIAGQGSVGLEIVEDLPGVDVVLVPIGGGGLSAGVASAVKALRPQVSVIGVEPQLAADAAESLRKDERIAWPREETGKTIADGVRSTPIGELPFAHLRERMDDVVTVSEQEILAAVRALARSARLVVEPSGAVSVAAYLYQRDHLPKGRTVAVISGGNVDTDLLASVLTE